VNGPDLIDGHAEEIGTDLEIATPAAAPSTLFRTDDPALVLERATTTANALKPVLVGQDLTSNIRGKEHVKVEGWQTLGAMLGVTPICTWTRRVEEPAKGWEARVEARTLDGRVIGAAEAMCDRSESKWKTSDDYAIRSMAQTRATSKALASVLRFIVTLAGYSGTPAEEMDGGAAENPPPVPQQKPKLDPEIVSPLVDGIRELKLDYGKIGLLLGAVQADGLPENSAEGVFYALSSMTMAQAAKFGAELARMKQDAAATAPQDEGS
jgi:hypothetical protein